uniref:Ion transport domain-containing protein n=1 Tax=Chlamydomonas euryale TaxID=1486919 RepID=A0A7R9VM28_9CHLO|mmetsp:Transcript_38066/g.112745  ORF Transcript_38066/g.112745 Transcript_38066/m.112745 type:complete len:146 (+) Transcript_38066:674-1111(+)
MVEESPDFVTAVRVFRLVRLFKADKYINAFQVLGSVLAENYTLLVATSFYSVLAWFVSAALLFFTEQNNQALGVHFQSIPAALFPTLLMLTGEFPMSDFTVPGRIISGVIAVGAVAIFAVPTAVLGSGFVRAVQQAQQAQFTVDA